MEQILTEIKKLFSEIEEIRLQVAENKRLLVELKKQLTDSENARYFDNWIPRKRLMDYLEYGDTQIAAILKQGELIVSEIGIRKFIKRESILQLLEKNIKK